jgi:ubiquinone/menaquinone biosynthesis C-methylase UbiE
VKVDYDQFYARKFKNKGGFWVDRYPPSVSLYADITRVRDAEILKEVNRAERVLDLGCGVGDLAYKLAQECRHVYGADIAPSNAVLARQNLDEVGKSSVFVSACSATHLPFPDEFFDRVIMADVIEHIPNIPIALREVRRVLKRNGRLICVTPDRDVQLLLVHLDNVMRGLRRPSHKMVIFERFLAPLTLRRHVRESGMVIADWRKVCFYPGPEGGGMFARLLRVIARAGVIRRYLVEPTFRPLFRMIEKAEIFNQKQMIIGLKVDGI